MGFASAYSDDITFFFLTNFLGATNISQEGLRYIGPMAVGFIVVGGAYRIGRKVVTDKVTLLLLLLGGIITYFIREPWIYPLVLVLGGIVSILTSKEKNLWNRVKISPPWGLSDYLWNICNWEYSSYFYMG